MISEIRKSINAILFERVTSPFYGSFVVAWFIWNWRIPYLTIFVSEDKILPNKLAYIDKEFINIWDMLVIPLIYTAILLTLGELISNGSYWLSLLMKQWKIKKRNSIEGKQLLTVEKSVQLRTEMQDIQTRFDALVNEKETEISRLKEQILQLNKTIASNTEVQYNPYASGSAGEAEYEQFKKSGKAFGKFMSVADHIDDTGKLPKNIDDEIEQYYRYNFLIETIANSGGKIRLTQKGAWFRKNIFNEDFLRKQSAPEG